MVDSTKVALPAAQAFLSGRLEMAENISPGVNGAVAAWADIPANCITAMVFALLALATLKSLLNLFPLLLDSLSRWKACLTIDSSVRLKSDRNLLGIIWLMPIIIIADRYRVFSIGFLDSIPYVRHIAETSALVIAWLLLRLLSFILCSLRAKRIETFRTAHKAMFNYLILLAAVMLASAGIFSLTNVSELIVRQVIEYEMAVFYLVAVLRETQILRTYCSRFQTFLYLCALEFIPTGILIAGNILL